MHAGGPEGYELGNSYRSSQAWQLSKYLTRSARQGRYVLACGDFNFQSNELPYRVMRDAGKVKDAWIEFAQRRADTRGVHDDGGHDEFVERWDMVGKGIPDAEQALDEAGVTVDCEASHASPLTFDLRPNL
jgi:endonuclease/exonuclease/phosphatase family metal-dependent hydrolase